MNKSKGNGYLLILYIFAILLSFSLITLRVEIINLNGFEPNFKVKGDMLEIYDNTPFYSDELTYFNYNFYNNFFDIIYNYFYNLFVDGKISTINLYGYYIFILTNFFKFSWIGLFWVTGFLYYMLFIKLVYMFLTQYISLNQKISFFLSLMLILSPPIMQISVTWMRDLLLIDLLLISIMASMKKNFKVFLIVTIIQFFLRTYMVLPHLIIYLVFMNKKHSIKKINFYLVIFFILIIFGGYFIFGFKLFLSEIPQRIVQNFSGFSMWLIEGKIILKKGVYNYLYNIEMLSNYYFFIYYFFMYLLLFYLKVIKRNRKNYEERIWFIIFLSIGLYITILHTFFLGFFVSRITLITQILSIFYLASVLKKHKIEK